MNGTHVAVRHALPGYLQGVPPKIAFVTIGVAPDRTSAVEKPVRRLVGGTMKATSADSNNGRCPICNDEVTEDPSGKGFVRHKTVANCEFERGQRDEVPAPPASPPSTGAASTIPRTY